MVGTNALAYFGRTIKDEEKKMLNILARSTFYLERPDIFQWVSYVCVYKHVCMYGYVCVCVCACVCLCVCVCGATTISINNYL
jgi:hypothetical protein